MVVHSLNAYMHQAGINALRLSARQIPVTALGNSYYYYPQFYRWENPRQRQVVSPEHPVGKWQSLDLNPGTLALELPSITIMLCLISSSTWSGAQGRDPPLLALETPTFIPPQTLHF